MRNRPRMQLLAALLLTIILLSINQTPTTATPAAISSLQTLEPLLVELAPDAHSKPPLVLVHGWQGTTFTQPCERLSPSYVDGIWGLLDEYLAQGVTVEEPVGSGQLETFAGLGFHVEMARLKSGGAIFVSGPTDPNWHCTPIAEDNVGYLIEAIDTAKAATGQSKVILIGHSMGGLVSRAYLEGPHYRDDVVAVVTMGTPHVGVPVDVLSEWVSFITLGAINLADYCNAQPAVCQFSDNESDSDFPSSYTGIETFNATHSQRADGVAYHLLGGDAGFFDRGWFGAIIDAIIAGPDDGIVPLPSALGETSQDGRLAPLSGSIDRLFVFPTLHIAAFADAPDCLIDTPQRYYTFKEQDEWVDPCFGSDYVNRFIPPLAFIDCLTPLLMTRTNGHVCGTVQTLAQPAGPPTTNSPPTLQRLPTLTGLLNAGETVTHPIQISGGETLFAVHANPEATIEVALRSPAGALIHPASTRSNITDSAALYWLDNAATGTWELQITALDTPSAGARYRTSNHSSSDATVEWHVDPSGIAPGAELPLNLSLPASATQLTFAFDGHAERFEPTTLNESERQQFTTMIQLPSDSTYHQIQLQVRGMLDGQPFAIERPILIEITPPQPAEPVTASASAAAFAAPQFDTALHQCIIDDSSDYTHGSLINLTFTLTETVGTDYAEWLDGYFIDAPDAWQAISQSAAPPDGSGWSRTTTSTACTDSGVAYWGIDSPFLAPLSDECELSFDSVPPAGSMRGPWYNGYSSNTLFSEGFEGVFPPAGWQMWIESGSPNNGFSQSTDQARSGSASARHNRHDVCLFCSNPRSWLVTPPLSIQAGDTLSFWQYIENAGSYDTRAIYASTGSGNPASGDFVQIRELGQASGGSWQQVTISLDDYASRTDVYLAFYYEGDNADRWFIDDVTLTRPTLADGTYQFDATYQIMPDAANSCPGSNVVGISGDISDPRAGLVGIGMGDLIARSVNAASCNVSHACPLPQARLHLSVSADGSCPGVPAINIPVANQQATYCFEIENIGATTLTDYTLNMPALGINSVALPTLSIPPGARTLVHQATTTYSGNSGDCFSHTADVLAWTPQGLGQPQGATAASQFEDTRYSANDSIAEGETTVCVEGTPTGVRLDGFSGDDGGNRPVVLWVLLFVGLLVGATVLSYRQKRMLH